MKAFLKSLIWMTCISLVLSACGPGGMSFFPTPEPAKLVFAAPSEYHEFYTAKIAEFKKSNPKVEIQLVKQDSSSKPDVAVLRWDQIQSAQGDMLAKTLDLSPFLEQSKTINRGDYFPGVLEPFTRDGKLKGLPTGVDPYMIFYNRDLFDNSGVPYPKPGWNWDQFKTTAMQLRDPIDRSYGYVTTLDYVDSLFFVYQHGGNLLNGDKPQLDTPEAVEAMEWYAALYTKANIAPTPDQVRKDFGGDIRAGIMNGKVGMWMSPISEIRGPDQKGWPFNIGVVPLPRDQTTFSVTQFEGLVIAQDTLSPQAAWSFMSFLVANPQPWMVPARLSQASAPAFATAIGPDQAESAMAAMKESIMISAFDYRLMGSVIEVFSAATQAVINGSATAQEALSAAQKRVSP